MDKLTGENCINISGNIPITVTGADGKTVQVSAATLQAAQLSGQSGGTITLQGHL